LRLPLFFCRSFVERLCLFRPIVLPLFVSRGLEPLRVLVQLSFRDSRGVLYSLGFQLRGSIGLLVGPAFDVDLCQALVLPHPVRGPLLQHPLFQRHCLRGLRFVQRC
jgi:hypothetical protein